MIELSEEEQNSSEISPEGEEEIVSLSNVAGTKVTTITAIYDDAQL
jgi:hypothetical protein